MKVFKVTCKTNDSNSFFSSLNGTFICHFDFYVLADTASIAAKIIEDKEKDMSSIINVTFLNRLDYIQQETK